MVTGILGGGHTKGVTSKINDLEKDFRKYVYFNLQEAYHSVGENKSGFS